MRKRLSLFAVVGVAFALVVYASAEKPEPEPKQLPIPEMKFNDVKEIAPGVFFRYSSISPNDPKIPFGGSNHTWIVFKDYVVVIDANFPKEAADVIADIKKTTKKPIKYVLDTHHHGDHAYGNAVWAKEGAQIVAHKNAARLLKVNGPKQWEDAAKDRKDIRESTLKQVDITFDDKYELKDDTQHVIFMHFGHMHTPGCASAYLPKHKILCTGDACVNGAFNYMGHSNSASWIKCLDEMNKLDIDIICPGHGKMERKELLAKEKRYFTELRAAVKKGIDHKKAAEGAFLLLSLAKLTPLTGSAARVAVDGIARGVLVAEPLRGGFPIPDRVAVDGIVKGLSLPWYKEWTGVDVAETTMNKDNVKHVYNELMGKVDHDRLGAGNAPLDLGAGPNTALASK
jgi:glyoxylase-like metal-dependent hydrolase (beta-lactamase superfamily II)